MLINTCNIAVTCPAFSQLLLLVARALVNSNTLFVTRSRKQLKQVSMNDLPLVVFLGNVVYVLLL